MVGGGSVIDQGGGSVLHLVNQYKVGAWDTGTAFDMGKGQDMWGFGGVMWRLQCGCFTHLNGITGTSAVNKCYLMRAICSSVYISS
jgi:hypothetical protein